MYHIVRVDVRGQTCVTSCVLSEGSHGRPYLPPGWDKAVNCMLVVLEALKDFPISDIRPQWGALGLQLNSTHGLPGTLFRSHIHRPGVLFLKCILPYLSPKYESQHGHNREG